MRVLHVISSGGMYGAEAVILGLLRRARDSGPEGASLAVFHHNGAEIPELYQRARGEGLAANLITCNGQMDLGVPSRLRAIAHEQHIDVAHAHGYKADIYLAAAFAGRDRPVLVSTCHTWYDNDFAVRLYGSLDRTVLRGFDEVVAVSAEVRTQLLQAGVAPARVHLVQNGLDTVPFTQQQNSDSFPRAQLRVGLAGRLAPEKGVDVFLKAALKLTRRFPGLEFAVAGDGPDRAKLTNGAEAQQLGRGLQFLGRPASMPAFYASLDLLVSASRQEGLPMVLLEGMASGLPVVATRVGEVTAVVKQGATGLLVPPEDPDALAEAVAAVLANPGMRQRFGEAGRARVLAKFSLERMAGEYDEIYRRALRRKSADPATRRLVGV